MRLLTLAALALATPLSAQEAAPYSSPELETFSYGVVCFYGPEAPEVPLTSPEVDRYIDTNIRFDDIRSNDSLLVPAVDGVSFGVVSSFPADVSYLITSIITHTRLDGTDRDYSANLVFDDQLDADAWTFDNAQERHLGTWRFLALQGDRPIYDVTLTVVPPEAYTDPVPPCITLP